MPPPDFGVGLKTTQSLAIFGQSRAHRFDQGQAKVKHSEIEGDCDWHANVPGAIDLQLAVIGVTRRRAGVHPTRSSCTTHKYFCPLECGASKPHGMSACAGLG